jgi:transcriptional regulator GlxA family with amidase domain
MTNSGSQLTGQSPVEIAIVCYPGAQQTCIHGLTDLFAYADYFARLHGATSRALLRVTHWAPAAGGGEPECRYDSHPGAPGRPQVAIIPASHIAPLGQGHAPQCVAWIARQHAAGAVVAAVCGGVFLLADSGLLAGRQVTTHWMFAEELRRRFPQMRVDTRPLVIDDNDIVTAGGVLAWADMGLSLVERLLGPTVMFTTARFMNMDPRGREQGFYSPFSPRLQHGDEAVLAIQHWLQANVSTACPVMDLAERAGLGARTFLRRFVRATGMKPSEYQQRLRIARSRELLEFTRDPVERIAAAVGYEDPSGFRRIFKRVVGLSPAEYRRRFQRDRSPGAGHEAMHGP